MKKPIIVKKLYTDIIGSFYVNDKGYPVYVTKTKRP